MTWVMCDIESDGPCPSLYSMVSFGAVIVEPSLSITFYGQLKPLEGAYWLPDALAISGHTREETLTFPEPNVTMERFRIWLKENCDRPMFISDNNGFDYQFINWYFVKFWGSNPFGHSSTNLGSLYKGMQKDFFQSFKHLRKTKHDHFPVHDALGNAEALLAMKAMGLKIKL